MSEMKKVKYNTEEILQMAEKMHEEYNMIFFERGLPVRAIGNLAKLLEEVDQTEENKMKVLEYAARIKYEIQISVDHITPGLAGNPKYLHYKSNDFAVQKAVNDIYTCEKSEEEYPKIIQSSIDSAYFYIKQDELVEEDERKLLFSF